MTYLGGLILLLYEFVKEMVQLKSAFFVDHGYTNT